MVLRKTSYLVYSPSGVTSALLYSRLMMPRAGACGGNPIPERMYQALDGWEVGKASRGRLMAGLKEADADGHAENDDEASTVMERFIEC